MRTLRPTFTVLAASLVAATMLVYVNGILRAYELADAAANGRPRGNLSDLYPRWLGTRELLLHRTDPYGDEITRKIQAGYYGRPLDPARPNDPKDQQAFAYPLYVVFLLAPTVWLPFPMVQKIGFWLLVFLTAATIPTWLRILRWRVSVNGQLIWIVLTLGSFPAIQGFKLQQLTVLVAALLAFAIYAISNRHFVCAGVLLALASIKPQLVCLFSLWLLIWACGNWHDRRRVIGSFIASMLLLVVAGELVWPGWIGEFRSASASYFRYTGGGKSVLDVLLAPWLGRVVSAVLVITVLVFLWRERRKAETSVEFRWSLALVVSTTLVVIPMFAPYNQILLLPALMLIVRRIRLIWAKNRWSKFLLAFTSVSIAWPWIAAVALSVALLFLPGATVQRAWAVPLYTSFLIPVTVEALVLITRGVLLGANGQQGLRPSSVAIPHTQQEENKHRNIEEHHRPSPDFS